jgi:hypothetical protein
VNAIKNDIEYAHDISDKSVKQCATQILRVMHKCGMKTLYWVRIVEVCAHLVRIAELHN